MPSTVIRSFRYLPQPKVPVITFISGKVYGYANVPKEVYDAISAAFSKDTYFNRYIKPNYPFKDYRDE